MRNGSRQLFGKRASHGAWRHATGLVLRRHMAGFYSAVDTTTVESHPFDIAQLFFKSGS